MEDSNYFEPDPNRADHHLLGRTPKNGRASAEQPLYRISKPTSATTTKSESNHTGRATSCMPLSNFAATAESGVPGANTEEIELKRSCHRVIIGRQFALAELLEDEAEILGGRSVYSVYEVQGGA